jgi:hypothetical protein
VASRLKGKRKAASKQGADEAATGKLKWSKSWAGVGLEKRRRQGNLDGDDSSSGSGNARAPLAGKPSSALRANGTAALGADNIGRTHLPFSGAFMCHDVSESYGAAWIIHKRKFLKTGFGPPWTEHFDTKDMAKPNWYAPFF